MSSIENSVVKIISTLSYPDYSKPWSSRKMGKGIGTGFCIDISKKADSKRIFTNAHVVESATSIIIIKQGSSMSYKARVEHVVVECDLAILVLHESVSVANAKSFWDKTPSLQLASMPAKMSKVSVYGFPLGGNNISITKGVISRTEILPYNYIADGIAIQIDAAINPGNSGGPAIDSEGKVIGVAFSGIDMIGIQNMGYIIPTLFVRYVLRYIKKHKSFGGLSFLGVSVQNLENENLRKFALLDVVNTGVLVNGVSQGSSAHGKLKPGDILIKINGLRVDYDGTMKLSDIIMNFQTRTTTGTTMPPDVPADGILMAGDEVTTYNSLIGLTLPGETITASIIRNGKSMNIPIVLKTRDFLIPISYHQIQPLYYILGGFVFIPLTRMFIIENLEKGVDVSNLVGFAEGGFPEKKGDQVIIVSTILSSALTHGYDANNFILDSINGTNIHNMSQLRKVADSLLSKKSSKVSKESPNYIVITYVDTPEIHVLNTLEVQKYGKKIIEENIGLIPHTNVL